MDFKDKAYWVQKIKTEYGVICPRIDVSHVQTTQDHPMRLNGEVKVNPFNIQKAELIRDTFDLGKLDWALVFITTDPPRPELEDEVFKKIKAFSAHGPAGKPDYISSIMTSMRTVCHWKLILTYR